MLKSTVWISLVVIWSPSLRASQPSARELLKAWEIRQEAMQRVVVRGEARTQRVAPGNAGPNYVCQMSELRVDGDKWDLLLTNWNGLKSLDEPLTRPKRPAFRPIWDGKCYYYENFVGVIHGRETGVLLMDDVSPHPVVQAFAGTPMLQGRYLSDERPFSELMAQDNGLAIRKDMEAIDGIMCYVLDATTPGGKYSVWLSPDHGYNVLRAEVQKGPNDLYGTRPVKVKDVYPQTRPAGLPSTLPWERHPPLVSISFVLSGVKCEKVDEVWVPVESTYEEVARDDRGQEERTRVSYKVEAVDLNPDFAALGAFVPNVPGGTSVAINGRRGVRYVWRDGKVAADTGQVRLTSVRGKVQLPDGTPAADVKIFTLSSSTDGAPLEAGFSFTNARTGADGTFELKGVPAGQKLFVYANTKDFQHVLAETIDSVEDPAVLSTPLVMKKGQTANRVLKDKLGKPCANMPVNVTPMMWGNDTLRTEDHQVTTDAEGRLKIDGILPGIEYLVMDARGTRIESGWRDTYYCDRIILIPAALKEGKISSFEGIDIGFSPEQATDKMILVCFIDMQQRPSRNAVLQLVRQAEQLRQKGVAIVAIQVSKMDDATLKTWAKDNAITFPLGMAQDDGTKTRPAWGIKALPWLILTDPNHIVIAEGFGVDEVDLKSEGAKL